MGLLETPEEKALDLEQKQLDINLAKLEYLHKQAEYNKLVHDNTRKMLFDLQNDAGSDFLNRRYYFQGTVNAESVLKARRWVNAWITEDPTAPITVEFMSYGGSCMAGYDLFGLLRTASKGGAHVTTIISGIAGSMAGVLAQAGDTRQMREQAYLHMHEAASGGWGKGSELRDDAAFVDRLSWQCAHIYAERSNLTAEEIFTMMDRKELYFDSSEALAHQFVDQII